MHVCANGILSRSRREAEGFFLLGLVEKASEHPKKAVEAFETVLQLDENRYDAAVELASQYSMGRRNGEVLALLSRYEAALHNSPKYLDMAGTVYTEIGMAERAWPLYQKACELQPEIDLFQANLASCAVFVGEIEIARKAYEGLLSKNPNHQRNHYQLARLSRASDTEHVEQMEQVLSTNQLPPDRNIFLHYALGKEYEDLQQWDKAFEHFKKGGDAVSSVANYDVASDVAIIDQVIESCNADWLADCAPSEPHEKTPMFIVGLPRTGTTLTERIVGSHSKVESVGETEFMQMAMRVESKVSSLEKMTPTILKVASEVEISRLRDLYLSNVNYRLGDAPIFIDKLPFNILYLGFIAKAWPGQKIILMNRNPMDSCFSMYKQVFTWAYKFSYDLDSLATYYIAYERLCAHWRAVLGEQLVELRYEELVSDQEVQTRTLLGNLGLEFEEACLNFEKNAAPSATASSVQVREKVHTGSVDRWQEYAKHLEPLRTQLEAAGIKTG